MVENPGEGRLTPEKEAILLRKARRRTVEMRRQLRDDIKKKENQEHAQRWQMRHRENQYAVEDIMQRDAQGGPQNRRTRRHYAKVANVYKVKNGWQDFMESYRHRFGYQTSVTVGKNNKDNGSLKAAMKKGDE